MTTFRHIEVRAVNQVDTDTAVAHLGSNLEVAERVLVNAAEPLPAIAVGSNQFELSAVLKVNLSRINALQRLHLNGSLGGPPIEAAGHIESGNLEGFGLNGHSVHFVLGAAIVLVHLAPLGNDVGGLCTAVIEQHAKVGLTGEFKHIGFSQNVLRSLNDLPFLCKLKHLLFVLTHTYLRPITVCRK